jgi:hypothetical protein
MSAVSMKSFMARGGSTGRAALVNVGLLGLASRPHAHAQARSPHQRRESPPRRPRDRPRGSGRAPLDAHQPAAGRRRPGLAQRVRALHPSAGLVPYVWHLVSHGPRTESASSAPARCPVRRGASGTCRTPRRSARRGRPRCAARRSSRRSRSCCARRRASRRGVGPGAAGGVRRRRARPRASRWCGRPRGCGSRRRRCRWRASSGCRRSCRRSMARGGRSRGRSSGGGCGSTARGRPRACAGCWPRRWRSRSSIAEAVAGRAGGAVRRAARVCELALVRARAGAREDPERTTRTTRTTTTTRATTTRTTPRSRDAAAWRGSCRA